MTIVCNNKKELREALKRKPESIIAKGELADSIRKTNSYIDKSKKLPPTVACLTPVMVGGICVWAFILVMGILLTIALFKEYEIEAEGPGGIKFKAKRKL